MRSRLIVVFLIAASVAVVAACGSASPAVNSTATPTSTPTESAITRPDEAVQAYLVLMDELAVELTRFSNPDGPGGSREKVIDLASRLQEYIPVFLSLDQAGLEDVLSTYGRQLEETATRVATLAAASNEIAGDQMIVSALERTPAFAAIFRSEIQPNTGNRSGEVSGLLSPEEVASAAGTGELSTTQRDQKAGAAGVDPAQVEHIDSFTTLSFDNDDNTRHLMLTTIDFDSQKAAVDHYTLVVSESSGMQDMPVAIGEASVHLELNQDGIGSMVIFRKGEWVVTLHTAQEAGADPLVGLNHLAALAQVVADRL